MADLSPEAREFGRRAATKLLDGRKGHGGAPVSYRVMREAELIALAGLAFDMGAVPQLERIRQLEGGLAQARACLHGAVSDADAPLISGCIAAIEAALGRD